MATLGRVAEASPDVLVGYMLSTGISVHANVVFDGRSESRVAGMVLEVTEAELLLCDRYEEPARYTRVLVRLASNREAWVYAHDGGKAAGIAPAAT